MPFFPLQSRSAGLTFALICGIVAATGASAARIDPGGDESLGCILTISGVIAPGDAERLRAALEREIGDPYAGDSDFLDRLDGRRGLAPPRICLNSEGGSLPDALLMADVLTRSDDDMGHLYSSIGTAVPAGASCYSACAVFFMAGGYQTESSAGRLPNRVLHATAELGFHAPKLLVRGGTYSEEAVNEAFGLAISGVRMLTERQADLRFPDSLLNLMVSTPHDDMYILSTMGEATQWMIDVAGLPWPARLGIGHFVNACVNARPAMVPTTGYYQSFVANHALAERSFFRDRVVGAMLVSSRMNRYGRGVFEFDVDTTRDFASGSFTSDPDPSEDGLNCRVFLSGSWPIETPTGSNYRSLYIDFASGGDMAAGRVALYPPWARFAEVAATFGEREAPGNAVIWSETRDGDTRCLTFDRNLRQTDDQACRVAETVFFENSGDLRGRLEFTWPSGATTTVGVAPNGATVNGNAAQPNYLSDRLPENARFTCLLNSGTGNTFCFEQRQL